MLVFVFPGLLLLLFFVAFLYSSVGHGGASGYLAVLILFGTAPALMKSSALILNIFVSLVAFYQYYRGGYFKWRLFIPFAVTSIPASYIGAMMPLSDDIYKKILGFCLILPILRLAGLLGGDNNSEVKKLNLLYGLMIGAVIGLISGMIGIGGGIILSPVILILHWAKMKETAAISSLFILVNSISGLIALVSRGFLFSPEIYWWIAVALAGGIAGSYLGSRKFNNLVLRYILSTVLLIASAKLIFA